MGLFAVILFANGLPLWQVITSWAALEYSKKQQDVGVVGSCRHGYWTCSADPLWAPVEFLTGFSYLFLFGAGFFLGPAMIMLAALVRMLELRKRGQPTTPSARIDIAAVSPEPLGEQAPTDMETAALLFDDVSVRPALFVKG